MENLQIIATDGNLHVEGFPTAVKLAKVGGEKAHKLGDLALHAQDLRFAADCLAVMNDQPSEFMQDVLWRSAIIHYTKCFSKGVRRALKPDPVYSDNPPEALEAWRWFLDLRNKHIAHDVSAFNLIEVGAVINDPADPHKIAKVACAMFRVVTLDNGAFGNLDLLVRHAREWVDSEQNKLCDAITADLEKESHHSLMLRPNLQYNPPTSVLQGRPATPATGSER
ncbi:hypothetical protein [Variovorax sp. dw_308]|uniref:hypothetical protein n=1 Tax=Variovorax sp. dw_308 TaxID=2721546 RepID=UPI001C48E24B|nr:hypothetical protein [Variovorax sp. dw_308]